MKFLLTNDDGVSAPGLLALRKAIEPFGSLLIVAPDQHQSGCSHQVTTGRGLDLVKVGDHHWALDGSPVDCARVGLRYLAEDIDWLISGINQGANLGADVYLSGTVAAAREACLLGKPAIAVSQYFLSRPIDWDRAADWTRLIVQRLLETPPEPGHFWNVNLPHANSNGELPECVFCPVDPNPLPAEYELREGLLHYRASYQKRLRAAGHDTELCFTGRIAISEIGLFPLGPKRPRAVD